MKKVGIFCGSSSGSDIAYVNATVDLIKFLTTLNIEIVYGGGNVGLMGVVAKTGTANNCKITGVITNDLLTRGVCANNLTTLIIANTISERKLIISNMCDAFISLPGGYGTLDEIFEIVTLGQLGYHTKPCGILNVNGFFDDLINFLNKAVSCQFIHPEHRKQILVDENPEKLFFKLSNYNHHSLDMAQFAIEQDKERISRNEPT